MRAADVPLLAAASILQLCAAAAIRLMSIDALASASARARPFARMMARRGDERALWAIDATGRRLRGGSSCLVRAVVADLMLGSPARPVRITIGVRRRADGELESHAWASRNGLLLTGGGEAAGFMPLLEWESRFA